MPSDNQLCANCQKRKTRPQRTLCNYCARHRQAQRQREKGITCAGCNRPPTTKSPLSGKERYGDYYCAYCFKRRRAADLQPSSIDPANIRNHMAPKPMPVGTGDPETQRNRRSLAHWLEAHRRTVARLAA